MAEGYSSQPEGMAWFTEQLADLRAQIAALRAANGLLSAIISRGGLTVQDGGGITIQDGGGVTIQDGGGIAVTGGGGVTVSDGSAIVGTYPDGSPAVYFGALGSGFQSGLTVYGHGDSVTRFVAAEQGNGEFYSRLSGHLVHILGDEDVSIQAPMVGITTSRLPLYSLPTTSAASNLHLGTVGGVWTVAYVTSSRRYKRDIRPTSVKPENVLAIEPVTFLEKTEVEAVGTDAPWRQGFIAEQVAEHTPQFVGLDDDGEPNSVDYDRFASVGHQVVLQAQQREIADLKAADAVKTAQIADLTQRLEALEAS